jgi:hypothetical protein
MGRKAVLGVREKKDVFAHRNQFLAASQQNIANHFSVLWDKHFSHHCIGDMLSEKSNWNNLKGRVKLSLLTSHEGQ